MNKVSRSSIAAVTETLLTLRDVKRATKYVTPKLIVRATKRNRRKYENFEVILTVDRPNYLETKFIKALVKAGEPFPVKKVQLKYWPKKKAA